MKPGKHRATRARRIWIGVGAAAILLYSLGPLLWIFIASITPELRADFDKAWLSNRWNLRGRRRGRVQRERLQAMVSPIASMPGPIKFTAVECPACPRSIV